ncbi:MAG: response regulator transcription factor [Anaerolineae bacterium]
MPQKAKVLVAEDESDIRNLIVFSLEYAGYTVVQAMDGEEAIQKAITEQPDLILLDVRMPRMNGYEACKRLKAHESTHHIPVVFLSARGQEIEIKQGLELGAVEYILKPFAPDELQQRVTSLLARTRHRPHDPPLPPGGASTERR